MNIASIMTSNPVTVEMDDDLSVVKEIFDNTGFHHLLVVEAGKLAGVLSDRDLLRAISPNVGTPNSNVRDEATMHKRVHQVMSRRPVTVSVEAGVYDAIDLFMQNDISCLPVVDAWGKVAGILSWRDIMSELMEKRRARLSASIDG